MEPRGCEAFTFTFQSCCFLQRNWPRVWRWVVGLGEFQSLPWCWPSDKPVFSSSYFYLKDLRQQRWGKPLLCYQSDRLTSALSQDQASSLSLKILHEMNPVFPPSRFCVTHPDQKESPCLQYAWDKALAQQWGLSRSLFRGALHDLPRAGNWSGLYNGWTPQSKSRDYTRPWWVIFFHIGSLFTASIELLEIEGTFFFPPGGMIPRDVGESIQ